MLECCAPCRFVMECCGVGLHYLVFSHGVEAEALPMMDQLEQWIKDSTTVPYSAIQCPKTSQELLPTTSPGEPEIQRAIQAALLLIADLEAVRKLEVQAAIQRVASGQCRCPLYRSRWGLLGFGFCLSRCWETRVPPASPSEGCNAAQR